MHWGPCSGPETCEWSAVQPAVGQGWSTVRQEEGGKSLCFEVRTVFVEMAGLCGYNKSSQRRYVTECAQQRFDKTLFTKASWGPIRPTGLAFPTAALWPQGGDWSLVDQRGPHGYRLHPRVVSWAGSEPHDAVSHVVYVGKCKHLCQSVTEVSWIPAPWQDYSRLLRKLPGRGLGRRLISVVWSRL